jgi:hypothetical protein
MGRKRNFNEVEKFEWRSLHSLMDSGLRQRHSSAVFHENYNKNPDKLFPSLLKSSKSQESKLGKNIWRYKRE